MLSLVKHGKTIQTTKIVGGTNMGRYDFDTVIDRKKTGSIKADFGKKYLGRTDLLPMWVADMDFALPEEILTRIRERIDHGIFGYTEPDETYADTLERWFLRRYGWKIDRRWNTTAPGVVYSIATAVRALTQPGDAVLIQEPVYYPFRKCAEQNGRICVSSDLYEQNGRYEIDFDDFERKIQENHVKLFILCSPHNPVGRVWTKEELVRLGDLCLKYRVKMIADEIHCDFIYPGHVFTPFGTLGEAYTGNAVICTAPSKTFNLAGLQISNILIPDPGMREAFRKVNHANGLGLVNIAGLAAAQAVYELGDEWLEELKTYLQGNLSYMRNYLQKELPQLRLIEPEGTYLVWVDFSNVVSTPEALKTLVRDKAGLWLDEGEMFGGGGALYERFNIACPRTVLQQAMEQLKNAVGGMNG